MEAPKPIPFIMLHDVTREDGEKIVEFRIHKEAITLLSSLNTKKVPFYLS